MQNPVRLARSLLLKAIPTRMPTNRRLADGHDIKVAVGRDCAAVSPRKGTYRGTARRQLSVEVLVSRMEQITAAQV